MNNQQSDQSASKFPGHQVTVDGSEAVVAVEVAASDAAASAPSALTARLVQGWSRAVAAGQTNTSGRPPRHFDAGRDAVALATGLSLSGLRATGFVCDLTAQHDSLCAAVGKRATAVFNLVSRAVTKQATSLHAGHESYHNVGDTGAFQLFAKNVQEAADLPLIAHRIAELALTPGICAQDGLLTSHAIETIRQPERQLIEEYLGLPADIIDCPTPAQRLVFGDQRRRVPASFDCDDPLAIGGVQGPDSYAQSVAAQRPFYFSHLSGLADQAFAEFHALTGRRYQRVSGHATGDAEYLILATGSVVPLAEAVCDYLRSSRGLKLGVVNVAMFRPFPADLLSQMLRNRKAVLVLERIDEPLAADSPLIREVRGAMGQAIENGRASGTVPYPDVAAIRLDEAPDFYSGCYGLGGRELSAADLIAAVENVLPTGAGRRHFYLGIDFIRPGTALPKLQIWQEKLLDFYPQLAGLALPPAESWELPAQDLFSWRLHGLGGWGAMRAGRQIVAAAVEVLGLEVKARIAHGPEKSRQATTFFASFSASALEAAGDGHPLQAVGDGQPAQLVLAADPQIFTRANALDDVAAGATFVLHSALSGEDLWVTLPLHAQHALQRKKIQLHGLDAFGIAAAAGGASGQRLIGAAFVGAFFRHSGLLERGDVQEEGLFDGLEKVLRDQGLDEAACAQTLEVARRGFAETTGVDVDAMAITGSRGDELPSMPPALRGGNGATGLSHPGRFWEQVGFLHIAGQDGIADPFAASAVLPAATGCMRDKSRMRQETPLLSPTACSGCGTCWTQCPEGAIHGVVSSLEEVIEAGINNAMASGGSYDRIRQVVRHLGRECRRELKSAPLQDLGELLTEIYPKVAAGVATTPDRRAVLDEEFAALELQLRSFPVARTEPFYDRAESQKRGSGGLLSLTVDPSACTGCGVCIDACPDNALSAQRQDQAGLERLRRQWELWQHLPETDAYFVELAEQDAILGPLPALLLKQKNQAAMSGGDSACPGCGEKTGVHLVMATINSVLGHQVEVWVARMEGLLAALDAKVRTILTNDADLEAVLAGGRADIPLDATQQEQINRILTVIAELKELRSRSIEGSRGRGRALAGIASASGCSSLWGATHPFNPYSFPWVGHLFQDAPALALGLFTGQMRKMADGFVAVRRAQLELDGDYDADEHEPFFATFDWQDFSAEERALCPPLVVLGGDDAMLDEGFPGLSKLLAAGTPIRVVVLDTQTHAGTGGQVGASSFHGQIGGNAAFGGSQKGNPETRTELALLAIAHRGAYVLQSSAAAPAHLLGGLQRGLRSSRPALFVLHAPCPTQHGFGDNKAARQAQLAVGSRAFPLLRYDPEAGSSLADCLCLDGNPDLKSDWAREALSGSPTPLTVAHWAATEGRFRPHFAPIAADSDEEWLPFHEYLALPIADREGRRPFIETDELDAPAQRWSVAEEIVALGEERLDLWSRLKEMAGLEVSAPVQKLLDATVESKLADLRAQYEKQIAELRETYPRFVAERVAAGLMRLDPEGALEARFSGDGVAVISTPLPVVGAASAVEVAEPEPQIEVVEEEEDEELGLEAYIESARCTSCDECINASKKLFAYNKMKQAYIKDTAAGPFQDLVIAAEKCPVRIIHPGMPLNPNEKDLEKWIQRAEPFN